MDWSRYVSIRVAECLHRRKTSLDLRGYDECPFHLSFRYPSDWDSLAGQEREGLIAELSLRIAYRVTFNALTWHEIITWFDYRTTLVVSEKGSAFTYEDTMSHVVGIYAADDALRHPIGSWDQDATRALANELQRVGVVSKIDAARAVELVKGQWWSEGVCIRRMLDVGLDGQGVRPWLVRGMPGGDERPAFAIPTLQGLNGRDCSGFWSMTIEPSWLIPDRVCKTCSDKHGLIDPEEHFTVLMEMIRREVRAEFGLTADLPYDR
jgi:hypothetical protein